MSVNLNTSKVEKSKELVKSHMYKTKHICLTESCCSHKPKQISLPFTLNPSKTGVKKC